MPGFCSKIISHCSKTAVSRGLLSLLSHIPTDLVGSRVPGGVRSRVCSAENTNPYQSLDPISILGEANPTQRNRNWSQATDTNPGILVDPSVWLQLWVAGTSICTSCHPSPRHRGSSFTKQPTGAPLPEKGRNSLARPKGKPNQNRKAMATSTAGPAAFSCIIAQSFILEIKFKKHGRNLLFHSGRDCNDNQRENNVI